MSAQTLSLVGRGAAVAAACLFLASGCDRPGAGAGRKGYTVHSPTILEIHGDPQQYLIAESMVVHAMADRRPGEGTSFSIPSFTSKSRSWSRTDARGSTTVEHVVTTFDDPQGREWRLDRVILPGPRQTVAITVTPPLAEAEEAALADRWRSELDARGFTPL